MKRAMGMLLASIFGLFPGSSYALEFNFRPEPGMAQEAIDGFRAAGDLWTDLFNDDITVNVEIGFRDLGLQILGQTNSVKVRVTYGEWRTAIIDDATSAADQEVVANLPAGAALDMLLNRTSNSPHGPGDATPFLDNDGDANNRSIRLTRANAKVLVLVPGTDPGTDASITFNSAFNWDFDPSDGVDPNSFNFIFVAAHEIGHALGFISGVDILDLNSPPVGGPFADQVFTYVSPVDVFRFSNQSVTHGEGIIDWTADAQHKYFSTDGGTIDGGGFSRGVNFGDGQQASHWRDNLSLGIMDPTAGVGELGEITELDVRLFEVIGYDTIAQVARFCRESLVDIPDNDSTGVTDSLVVTDVGALIDLDVEVTAEHTWVGDLVFVLRHQETSTQVTLVDRPGMVSGGFGCSGNDVEATLDDAATDSVESACRGTAPAIQGELKPQQSLQAFAGEDLSGTWTLTLSDNAAQDQGRLVGWCLLPSL